jgi:hypothetical protein
MDVESFPPGQYCSFEHNWPPLLAQKAFAALYV